MSMVFNIARKKKQAVNENGFYFTAPESFRVSLGNSTNGNTWNGTIQTSLDGNTWTDYNAGNEITSNVENGNRVYFRGNGNTYISSTASTLSSFILTGNNIACHGNIMILLDSNAGTIINQNYCFKQLFRNCTNLVSAPELPATTLADDCYYEMFIGCASLTSAPALPATTLADDCYANMFIGCASLTSAPALPATILARGCYQYMFRNCTSIMSIPALPADILTDYCYTYMFYGCTSLSIKTASDGSVNTVPWRLPHDTSKRIQSLAHYSVNNMFGNTQYDIITEPSINVTYYTRAVVLPDGTLVTS